MAMLAGARSLHARPWERRYRHAFGGWFERGRLNLERQRDRFSEIAGKIVPAQSRFSTISFVV